MNLLNLKINKLKDYAKSIGLDTGYIILKNSENIRYMVSEIYYPPPDEVSIHRIVLDFHSDVIELYVSPVDFYRVHEIYRDRNIEIYAVLSSCVDVPQDMKCIEKKLLDSLIMDRMRRYRYVAVDDTSICSELICIDIGKAIKEIRRNKRFEEVELIKKAVSIAEQAIYSIISEISLGLSEIAIASIVEHKARELGAEGFAFSTIVAIGENTAKPHHIPTTKILKSGEPILIDFGVRVLGYVSDITRIFIPSNIDEKYKEIVDIIEEALLQGLSIIKDGVKCSEVDEAVRSVLRMQNLHKYFIHGTGHGFGVDVHEEPRLTRSSRDVLLEGDTVTIEPGVYIYNKYGARLEDNVYIDKYNIQVLSRSPRVIEI